MCSNKRLESNLTSVQFALTSGYLSVMRRKSCAAASFASRPATPKSTQIAFTTNLDTRCSWTRRALAITFPPCLSRKRPSYGHGVLFRWPFPPACRGKGTFQGHAPVPYRHPAITRAQLQINLSFYLTRKLPDAKKQHRNTPT